MYWDEALYRRIAKSQPLNALGVSSHWHYPWRLGINKYGILARIPFDSIPNGWFLVIKLAAQIGYKHRKFPVYDESGNLKPEFWSIGKYIDEGWISSKIEKHASKLD